jgi:lipopolysaccharide transport system permease protein
MKNYEGGLIQNALSIWRNRSLIRNLAIREIEGRYRGSIFGIFWSFINPLLMLAIYTLVFGEILNSRWVEQNDSKATFAIVLFAGLIPFNFFSECLMRSPGIIVSNVNYVKKVVFPLEILPISIAGAAFFHLIVSLLVWFICYAVFIGAPPTSCFLLPIILLPLMLMTLGFSWFLASLGVYIRDISQFIGLAISMLMFLSPIFYPITAIPKDFQILFLLNPLSPTIEMLRDILIWGKVPDWFNFIVYLAISLFIAKIGFSWFQKTRKGFADVL